MRSPPGDAGFTLLEALTAMAILALLSGLVFPAVAQGVAAVAFQQTVVGLRSDLAMARAEARRSGAPIELRVAASGEGYGCTAGPQRELIAGMRLSPAGGALRFYPDGSSTGGALRLDQGRRHAAVEVDAGSGMVEIAR